MEIKKKAVTVLCYGDSNTYGYDPRNEGRYTEDIRWPTVMAEMLGFVPKMLIIAPAAIRPELEGTPFAYQLNDASIQKSHDIAPLYKKLAEEHGCLFLDATDSAEVTQIDCEHLTVKGHRQLAELIYETVKGL